MKNSLNGSVVTSLQECTDVNITPASGEDGKAVTYDHASGKFILAAASGGVSKIEDADDVNVTLGAGEDEKALCYDHDTGKFVLRQVTIGACLLSSGATVGASSQAQAFTSGVKTGLVFPAADGTASVKVCKADGTTSVIEIDTTNKRVGIQKTTPGYPLDIGGSGLVAQFGTDPAVIAVGSLNTGPNAFVGGYYAAGGSVSTIYFGCNVYYSGSWINPNGSLSTCLFNLYNGNFIFFTGGAGSGLGTAKARLFNSGGFALGNGILATDPGAGNCHIENNLAVGNVAPGTKCDINKSDAVTNAVTNVLTIRHASTGTPAAGFGAGVRLGLESSTTENQDAAVIEALWNEATHASRKADLVLSVYDTSKREGLRIRGAGSAPAIGFLGATPATRIAHVADAVTAHAVTDPGDSPADADALRDDLVTNVIPSMETQLNNLGTIINSILTTLETFGFHAAS